MSLERGALIDQVQEALLFHGSPESRQGPEGQVIAPAILAQRALLVACRMTDDAGNIRTNVSVSPKAGAPEKDLFVSVISDKRGMHIVICEAATRQALSAIEFRYEEGTKKPKDVEIAFGPKDVDMNWVREVALAVARLRLNEISEAYRKEIGLTVSGAREIVAALPEGVDDADGQRKATAYKTGYNLDRPDEITINPGDLSGLRGQLTALHQRFGVNGDVVFRNVPGIPGLEDLPQKVVCSFPSNTEITLSFFHESGPKKLEISMLLTFPALGDPTKPVIVEGWFNVESVGKAIEIISRLRPAEVQPE